jgi:dihydrodipicolinate synthase/N-acetylneuraminate lyase
MKPEIPVEKLSGVWSAAPTPFDEKMEIDTGSIKRMVDHHLRLGISGLFLAGTNGEGPWMPERQRRALIEAAARYARGRMLLAVQVTDNSAARILDNIAMAREDGADIAVIAPPYFQVMGRPNVARLYLDAIRQSVLPIGIYDRGRHSPTLISEADLKQLYLADNVVLVKDSSGDGSRRALALACRRKRPSLRLLSGSEFDCVVYLKEGYDGLLLGGGVFNGYLAGKIIEAVKAGDIPLAEKLQARMNRIMYAAYGGKKIKCWLSGEKKLLVEMGIFRTWNNYLQYPLTNSCIRAIGRVIERDADVLMP